MGVVMSDTVVVVLLGLVPVAIMAGAYLLGGVIRFGMGDASDVPIWLFHKTKRLSVRFSQNADGSGGSDRAGS